MKFVTSVPGFFFLPRTLEPWHYGMTPTDMMDFARRLDAMGYDYLSVPDHVVMPTERLEAYGARWPDAIVAMSYFAAVTERIRIVTGVLVLPYRNPVILAKAISTLDYYSGGRITLGIGVGDLEPESDILNAPHHNRGVRADEYIRAMKELWASDEPKFEGEFVQFENIAFDPKSVQKPHPPLWVGGHTRRAMRRAASYANGWQPFSTVTLEELPGHLEYIRQQPGYTEPFDIVMPSAAGLGRDGRDVSRDQALERLDELARIGITHTGAIIGRASSKEGHLEKLQWFAEEVMPACHD